MTSLIEATNPNAFHVSTQDVPVNPLKNLTYESQKADKLRLFSLRGSRSQRLWTTLKTLLWDTHVEHLGRLLRLL